MAEKTVTVGDTDVQIEETDDGFEVTEVHNNELAEYVRTNVTMAGHEMVRETDNRSDREVKIVDTSNNVISNNTFRDIMRDDSLQLGAVEMKNGQLQVEIFSYAF